jgi:hypothetical protein
MSTSLLMPGKYDYGSFRQIPKPTSTTAPLEQLDVSTMSAPLTTGLHPPDSPLGDLRPILETPTYSPPNPLGTR